MEIVYIIIAVVVFLALFFGAQAILTQWVGHNLASAEFGFGVALMSVFAGQVAGSLAQGLLAVATSSFSWAVPLGIPVFFVAYGGALAALSGESFGKSVVTAVGVSIANAIMLPVLCVGLMLLFA